MGSKQKHEVKALTYFEIGGKLDDQLEAAQKEQAGMSEAKNALASAKTLIEGLSAHVDREVKEGTLDLEQATLVKRWIIRAASVAQNLGIQAEVQNYQAQGKVMALKHAVKVTKTLYDAERVSLDEAVKVEQGLVEETDPRRPDARLSGTHPGNPLADRRAEGEPHQEDPVEDKGEEEPAPPEKTTIRPPKGRASKKR